LRLTSANQFFVHGDVRCGLIGTHSFRGAKPTGMAALLEIACFTPEHAVLAFEAGADRIELCDNREAGGTSPDLQSLVKVKQHVTIPVFAMIRPRGGDFNYTTDEFNQMQAKIEEFKPYADGFVFGVLDFQRRIDASRTRQLVASAHPLPCTFHRAFDETSDLFVALEEVMKTGCSAILTSGGAPAANSGIEVLAQLVRMAQRKITIIPGGGLRAKNIMTVRGYTQALVFHSSAVLKGEEAPSTEEIRQLKSSLQEQNVRLLPLEPPSPAISESSSDGELSVSEMQMSAVSIGNLQPNI